MNVTIVLRQVLRCHMNTDTHHPSRFQKSTPCVIVTPGFCFLHAYRGPRGFPFTGTHVERWYVWKLNRTPQRIPNWEHEVMVVDGRFIFTFYSAKRYLRHTSTVVYKQQRCVYVILRKKKKTLHVSALWNYPQWHILYHNYTPLMLFCDSFDFNITLNVYTLISADIIYSFWQPSAVIIYNNEH